MLWITKHFELLLCKPLVIFSIVSIVKTFVLKKACIPMSYKYIALNDYRHFRRPFRAWIFFVFFKHLQTLPPCMISDFYYTAQNTYIVDVISHVVSYKGYRRHYMCTKLRTNILKMYCQTVPTEKNIPYRSSEFVYSKSDNTLNRQSH